MAKRKTEMGLGRGLNALLGDPDLTAGGEGSVSLPISQVEPGLNQPRKRFEPEALADLAESIRIHGIIQPLTVRRLASGYYQIIAGERRWRAAKQAGLDEVPAVIIEADDRKVMELGRKVTISHHGKKGRVQLEYYNNEDLEALLSLLNTLHGEGVEHL